MSCEFKGCNKPVRANGLCNGHYQQRRDGKELTTLTELPPPRPVVDGKKQCSMCDKWKSTKEFYLKNKKTGLLTGACKPCYSANEARKQREAK
jgi:hypothetical protein